jgi:mannose-6-phosphate isomerase-like protein (cupin superfamily)
MISANRSDRMDTMPNPPDAHVVAIDELPGSARGRQFDGAAHGAQMSFILALNPPGSGPALHRHPYEETFIIEEGTVRFTVGEHQLEATGGDVVVVPAGVPHGFVNVGPAPMRSINVHPVARMQTEWLA